MSKELEILVDVSGKPVVIYVISVVKLRLGYDCSPELLLLVSLQKYCLYPVKCVIKNA